MRYETKALLRQRFGGTVSHVVADPECATFSVPDIEGVIAYRNGGRCQVALGDPIADPDDAEELAQEFQRRCEAAHHSTIFACASERFTERLVARGYAAAEYGEELIFDPRRDPTKGSKGRELRKKITRAEKNDVEVREYRPGSDHPALATSLEGAARRWLGARRGPQTFVSPVLLFSEPWGRRWFYALHRADIVGVLTLVRLDAHDGYVFEHHLSVPDAPPGTSEILIVRALQIIGEEGCAWATFGPSTLPALGALHRVGRYSEIAARAVFGLCGRLFHFDSHSRYRRKFQPVRCQPSHLLFHPPRFGLREILGLLRAFHVSLTPKLAA